MKAAPQVVVIGGPNGAGKSTCAPVLLRDRFGLFQFVNPDSIAIGISAFRPESVTFEAGRIMLRRLQELTIAQEDFAFESTLSGRSYAVFLSELISSGYELHLLYIWVRTPEIAVERVRARVRRGGHSVSETDIRRRYDRSTYNFINLYSPLASSWTLFDNTERPIYLVANGGRGFETRIHRQDLWVAFTRPSNDSANSINL